MARVVRPKKGRFPCAVCRKKFAYEMHLGRHRQVAHDDLEIPLPPGRRIRRRSTSR
jgi:hypothetical protein